ncbi:Aquaporin, MIP family, PIP subfamily [Heracleum sosnowskyi]|uniref:Aquaporin, MIP family, PIP subfamily n=1 Tax=Heracleum sosnowskyi TaxID=360622 RepID=A0AAD8HMM1_9APIA|nr:Aquaporin, MIP family, PIP subfamily [Heracleum sosnowskyi]
MGSTGVQAFGDEENLSNGTRVQPLSATPKSDHWKENGEKRQTSFTLGERLGFDELFSLNLWRASIGELLGSAVLVFAIDTIVIASVQTETKTPNLLLSLLIAITVTILLLAVHPVSGGHINPVISFSAALVGLISMSRAVVYILAQCVGAVLAVLALKAVVSSQIQNAFSLGGCTLTVIAPGPNGPITVGLLVFISTTVTGKKGYAGAGINPARCIGPALVRGGHLWEGHWVFWAGPGAACVAFYIYIKIIPSQHFHIAGYEKHDFLNVLKALVGSNGGN